MGFLYVMAMVGSSLKSTYSPLKLEKELLR
jgi:hypothetical protein